MRTLTDKMTIEIRCRAFASALVAVLAAGCSGAMHSSAGSGSPYLPAGQGAGGGVKRFASSSKIQHIVYIVQENRSFNNLFYGYPNAYTVSSGKNTKGQTIALQPVSLSDQYVIDHSLNAFLSACNGTGTYPGTNCRMNGWENEENFGGPDGKDSMYVYVPHSESKPYFDMAHEWVLADHMFQSHLDESFVSHQYIIAAQAAGAVDLPNGFPWGCPAKGEPYVTVATLTQQRTIGKNENACWDYTTLGDELDSAGLSWRFYSSVYDTGDGVWSSYQAVNHIFNGPDWPKDVITPQTRFFTDIQNGYLANFTWITPICQNSDHVNCGGGFGPSWVTALVDAVGNSPFWDTTAIFVQWDDWGGLYDPVAPTMLDYDGTGFRVPLLIISPYAKKNYVSHVPYETASVLRFAEDNFGLAQMAAADTRATDPAVAPGDAFDFSQSPRPFVPISAPGASFRTFEMQPADTRIPDYE